jgi:hypothetical protein
VLAALADHPGRARRCLSAGWIDRRLRAASPAERMEAALALGSAEPSIVAPRLRVLLADSDPDVRRAALLSAARRPSRQFLDLLLPALFAAETSREAHEAMVAVGDPAVQALEPYLEGARGLREQSLAAHALADTGGRRARRLLMALARSNDPRLRHLGLTRLARMRLRTGNEVMSRGRAHHFFLRELRDCVTWNAPAHELAAHPAPEIGLLARSCLESSDMALARALQALACWYDPAPLIGAYDRLSSRDPAAVALALEYLAQILPRRLFATVEAMFDEIESDEKANAAGAVLPGEKELTHAIELAWQRGDTWLRACAVRASCLVPGIDARAFFVGGPQDAMVRAELDARRTAA